MAASEGNRPKWLIKPIYDPDFVYKGLPVKPLFSDDPLEQQFDASAHPPKSRLSVSSSAKSKASASPLLANQLQHWRSISSFSWYNFKKKNSNWNFKCWNTNGNAPSLRSIQTFTLTKLAPKIPWFQGSQNEPSTDHKILSPVCKVSMTKLTFLSLPRVFFLMIKGYEVSEREVLLSQNYWWQNR